MGEVNAEGMTDIKEEGKVGDEPKEVLDPGQEEGNAKKTYHDIPENSERGKKIYWQAKEYERKEEEYKGMGDMKDAMKTMTAHNAELAKALTRNAQATEAQVASTQVDVNEVKLEEIDGKLAKANEDKTFALKDNNAEAVVALDKEILTLTSEKAKTEVAIENKVEPPSEDMKVVQGVVNSIDWLNPKNEKYDVVMESAAMALDASLRSSVVDTKERLERVTKEIERRFSYTEEKKEEKASSANISGALSAQPASIRIDSATTNADIELSEAQVKAAKYMFGEEADPINAYKNQLRLMAQ